MQGVSLDVSLCLGKKSLPLNIQTEALLAADFAEPLQLPGAKKSGGDFVPDELALATIISMGFNVAQATKALKATVRML